jgi:DNA-binding winged helix-turn-helix (wHTH) protein
MSGEFRVGPSLVQPSLNSIIHNGKTARLEPKVMEVLVYLAEHQGQVVSKERLMRAVWAETFVSDDVLTRCISELRRALEDDAKEPHVIQTIPKTLMRGQSEQASRKVQDSLLGPANENQLPLQGLAEYLSLAFRASSFGKLCDR